MPSHKAKAHTEKLMPDTWRHPSRENLIFAGIITCIACLLIAVGILKYTQSQDQTVYARAQATLSNNACPGCGQWGLPQCPNCRFALQWNSTQGFYVCPRCRMQGTPYCPSCRRPVPMPARGLIGCIPPNPGFTPPQTSSPQNGAMLAA